jgi:four helix bundle protein
MTSEDLKQRTKAFAYGCIDLAVLFPETTLGRHIRGQLIRCSTSVAANYRAACLAQSRPTFIAKVSIAVEECDESDFWLTLAFDKCLVETDVTSSLIKESKELTAILNASRKTAAQAHKADTTRSLNNQ